MSADDDPMLAELRRVLDAIDPIPAAVQIAARAAIEWRTIDAELAALVHDSSVDEPEFAVRGAATAPRCLTFEAGELTIEVEAEPGDDDSLRIVGQLVPPQAAQVAVLPRRRADRHARRRARALRRRRRLARPAQPALPSRR